MSLRMNYNSIAPDGARALYTVLDYVAKSGLPSEIIELAYLRSSQINGCAFCIDMHSRQLLANGMDVERLDLVAVWEEAGDLFDVREKAALAYTEHLTRLGNSGLADADYNAAADIFSDKELVDLAIAIGLANAYNRLSIAFRSVPAPLNSGRETQHVAK